MKTRSLTFGLVYLTFLISSNALAQGVPQLINYQGRLTDDAGLPIDGTVEMGFKITSHQFDQDAATDEPHTLFGTTLEALVFNDLVPASETVTTVSGNTVYSIVTDYFIDYPNGTIQRVPSGSIPDGGDILIDYTYNTDLLVLWSETVSSVDVNSGIYHVELGRVNPIPSSVFSEADRFLEVIVQGERLEPRQRITSVAYALKAESVPDGSIGTSHLADDAVTSAKIMDGEITGTDIGAGTITGSNIDSQTITGSNITDETITSTQIQDSSIIGADIGTDELGETQIQDIYVLNTGDTVTGPLYMYGSPYGAYAAWEIDPGYHYAYFGSEIYGVFSSSGELGEAGDRYGGRFNANSANNAYGVFGSASASGALWSAYGVRGQATSSTSDSYGGYFSGSAGTGSNGIGVLGLGFNNSTGDAYGGYFETLTSGTGTHYGVYAESDEYPGYFAWSDDPDDHRVVLVSEDTGISAVSGQNDETASRTGGYFMAKSQGYTRGVNGNAQGYGSFFARGIEGTGSATGDGDAYGGYFSGIAYGAGTGYGVYAQADDYAVYGAYTNDPGDHYAYLGSEAYGVRARSGASDETAERRGGYFESHSQGASYGVRSEAYGYGGWNALGVYGEAQNLNGAAYGGFFRASSAGTGLHYGVYAEADDYGVYGAWSVDPTHNRGTLGTSTSGVSGECGTSSSTGACFGGVFISYSSDTAFGVSGDAYGSDTEPTYGSRGFALNQSSGDAYGGYFYTSSNGTGDHYGVYGYANGNSGSNGTLYGGYFAAASVATGLHYGIYAEADDYAGWFENSFYPQNYASIGSTSYGISAHAGSSSHAMPRFGGEFASYSQMNAVGARGEGNGYGTFEAIGISGVGENYSDGTAIGGFFEGIANGDGDCYGVYGKATSSDLGKLYGGYFSAGDVVNSYGVFAQGGTYPGWFQNSYLPGSHYAALAHLDYGVYARVGINTDTASKTGGYFYATSANTTYGVNSSAQITSASNKHAYGIYAMSNIGSSSSSGNSYAVYGYAFKLGTGTAYGIYNAAGTKSWVNPDPDDPTKSIVYATLEGGENGTYWRGTGRLKNGRAEIVLPEHFRKVTSPDYPVTAVATPVEHCNGLVVVERTNERIVVEELLGGTSDAGFDFIVMGKRLGYEDFNPEIDNVDYVPFQGNQESLDESKWTTQEWYDSHGDGLKKIFKKNGTLKEDGSVNEDLFKEKGWKMVKEKKEK